MPECILSTYPYRQGAYMGMGLMNVFHKQCPTFSQDNIAHVCNIYSAAGLDVYIREDEEMVGRSYKNGRMATFNSVAELISLLFEDMSITIEVTDEEFMKGEMSDNSNIYYAVRTSFKTDVEALAKRVELKDKSFLISDLPYEDIEDSLDLLENYNVSVFREEKQLL